MNKSRSIIEKRLNEKEVPKEVDVEHKDTPFEKILSKITNKIDKRPVTKRLDLYKALLHTLVEPVAAAGAARTKLSVAARDFLRDFNKHAKDEE